MAKKKREILVNEAGGETRVAVTQGGRIEELWIEHTASPVGDIYKGRVTNVERGLQAAFVDIGLGKEGFLHVADVHPKYFRSKHGGSEKVGRRTRRRERPPIEACLRRGDEVVVQVTKDGFGRKGPCLSTYLSIPGRTLVLLPNSNGAGVSRRVTEGEDRRRGRDMLDGLEVPAGAGLILRTAGHNASKSELQADAKHLSKLWGVVNRRVKNPAPHLLLREYGIVTQVIRDRWTKECDRVVVDAPATAEKVAEYLRLTAPRMRRKLVEVHEGQPIFEAFGIEEDVARLRERTVPLPSGGSIVIDPTEALVAIDVNSGRMRNRNGIEDTALRTNLEAAEEVARQLRLRDLGGLVVVDFIDLMREANRRKVTDKLEAALAEHRERAKVLPMSEFGLVQITRQRSRASMAASLHDCCPTCSGLGMVRSKATVIADLLRDLRSAAAANLGYEIHAWGPADAVSDILNKRREDLAAIERLSGAPVALFAAGPDKPPKVVVEPKAKAASAKAKAVDYANGGSMMDAGSAESGRSAGGRKRRRKAKRSRKTKTKKK